MTDRPALAEAIIAVLGAPAIGDRSRIERVLAEHEMAESSARQLIGDVLEEYAEEHTKDACDTCSDCGPVVMCRFHSVLSALRRGAWTNPAIERDALRTRAEAAEARCAQLEQERDEWKAAADVHIHAQQETAKLLTESRTEMYQLQAEHERLRAALMDALSMWDEVRNADGSRGEAWEAVSQHIKAALAPSQEPAK